MKLLRLLSRLAILLAVAAALVGLTEMYGHSGHAALPNAKIKAIGPEAMARWEAEKRDKPSAPSVDHFPDFLGYSIFLAFLALTGRVLFRMRLNPPPRSEGRPLLLDLRRRRQES